MPLAIYGPTTVPTRLKLGSLCNIFMVFLLTVTENDGPDQPFAHGWSGPSLSAHAHIVVFSSGCYYNNGCNLTTTISLK